MEPAPFHQEVALGPKTVDAVWLHTSDGVRVRTAVWRGGREGTVFIFPGRSEYVEKYGRTASALLARGVTAVSIDWRGQGLADRLLRDPTIGHVRRFSDYQRDVEAMFQFAEMQDLPQPWYLLAHSMGGCIGLRTLLGAHPFAAAGFSAPMWGVRIAPKLEALAHVLPILATRLGLGNKRTPTTGRPSYMLEAPFEGNLLTTDPEMWDYIVAQARADAGFRLGGPSLTWLAEALAETRSLLRAPRPDLPAHASVGTLEKIVIAETVETMMSTWTPSSFSWVDGAEHELLMERPAVRDAFLEQVFEIYGEARRAA
ncbi:MAG: alpha/beta hydrolase [Pseudomonadota bacterium]